MLSEIQDPGIFSGTKQPPIAKWRSIEWLGQMAASLCWMSSMAFYGLSSFGDWLQLLAASAWLVANLASLLQR